jgi:hypothetical protein
MLPGMPEDFVAKFWANAPRNCWLVLDYHQHMRIVATTEDLLDAVKIASSTHGYVLIWSPPAPSKVLEEALEAAA